MTLLRELKREVAKLETQTSGSGGRCPHEPRIQWPDGSITPEGISIVCPLCGRNRTIIKVVYDG